MKDTCKALAVVLSPAIITVMIFNATVLKAYANAKRMEMGRAPAVETKQVTLKSDVEKYLKGL